MKSASAPKSKNRLEDLGVLVVDCQTTGSSPKTGRLLEVGWARCSAREKGAVDAASRLVRREDSSAALSRRITKLTGIDDGALACAPTEEQVFFELCEAIEQGAPTVAVAHFARFERGFLDELFQRLGGKSFPLPWACTHELARRLHPSLPRLTLRALCGYRGHFVTEKRRAEAHVIATAHLWRELVSSLERERGIEDVESLWDFLATSPPKRPDEKRYRLGEDQRSALPAAPGIYRFYGPDDTLLYVGKATNLRTRVASYFTRSRKRGEHILEMVTMASRLEHEQLLSPLEAALREQKLIASCDPPYNRALCPSPDRAWFASADFSAVFEPASASEEPCHGPFTSRESLERFGELRAAVEGDEGAATRLGAQIEAPMPVALAGRELFVERYLGAVPAESPKTAARLLALGAIRFELRRLQKAKDGQILEDGNEPVVIEGPEGEEITAEQVARFFASVAKAVGRQWKTAWSLRLLAHCTLAWRPKTGAARGAGRLIEVRAGEIAPARPWRLDEEPPPPAGWERPLCERRSLFEPVVRDRLRVLLSEIHRLCKEGRPIRLRLSDRPSLCETEIFRLFGGEP